MSYYNVLVLSSTWLLQNEPDFITKQNKTHLNVAYDENKFLHDHFFEKCKNIRQKTTKT